MKIRILSTLFVVSCLTSCAPLLTQQKVDQIKPGVTTRADLVQLFGPPETQLVSDEHDVYLDWFRSEPAPVSGYVPLVGSFLGGLNLDVEQLSVHLAGNGRV